MNIFRNVTKEKVTTVVAALVTVASTIGYLTTEQGDAITAAGTAIAVLVLAFAKDPQ